MSTEPETGTGDLEIPKGLTVVILVDMVCPDEHIHQVPLVLKRVVPEGLFKQIEEIKEALLAEGWRPPSDEDYEREFYKNILDNYKSPDPRGDA